MRGRVSRLETNRYVAVRLQGRNATRSVSGKAGGTFEIRNLLPGTYEVKPEMPGCGFTPASPMVHLGGDGEGFGLKVRRASAR